MKKEPLLIFIPFVLASCSPTNSAGVVEVGKMVSDGELSPKIRTACSANKEQEGRNVAIEVNLGHYEGFSDDWNENLYGTNLGYGDFSLIRCIKDAEDGLVSQTFFTVSDFPSGDYDFQTRSTDGSNKESVTFNYSLKDTFDIPDGLTVGSVAYSVGITYENEVVVDNIKCGIFLSTLYFEIKNNACTFYIYEYELNA